MSRKGAAETIMVLPIPSIYLSRRGALCPGKHERCSLVTMFIYLPSSCPGGMS